MTMAAVDSLETKITDQHQSLLPAVVAAAVAAAAALFFVVVVAVVLYRRCWKFHYQMTTHLIIHLHYR